MFRTAVYGVCEEQMVYGEKSTAFWDYLLPFIRFWGVFTSVVVFGVGVDIAMHKHNIGLFYMLFAALVFFLEITWIITLFIQLCSKNEFNSCYTCWEKVLWFRLWKRSVLYTIFALILFIKPHRLWLSVVAGIQLLLLAGMYSLLTYRSCSQIKMTPSPRLLHSHSPSQEDYKYDNINEVLDDSLPTPLLHDNLSQLDHDTILEM